MATKTKIAEYQGQEVIGYKSGTAGPAIVILHDWWGCTQSVQNIADRLANLGNQVLALDYYFGYLPANYKEAEKKLWAANITDITEILILKAVEHFGKAHLFGMGFGASCAMIAQQKVPNVRSVTAAYGLAPQDRVTELKVPFMAIRADKGTFDNPKLTNIYLNMAPRHPNGTNISQVMSHNCNAEFLNETSTDFDFKRLKATCEAISAWVGYCNRDYPDGYF